MVAAVASQSLMQSPWQGTPRLLVWVVWVALCFSVIIFFGGWKMFSDSSITPQHTAPTAKAAVNDNKIYTGSIVVVPRNGTDCWKLAFDNRNDLMWGGRYLDCNAATETIENQQRRGWNAARLQAIGAAFRGK
jgi:hypothetical protein